MRVKTLSSRPNSSRKEKYFSTLGSFFENKCSIEKSILRFGMKKDQNNVIIKTSINGI